MRAGPLLDALQMRLVETVGFASVHHVHVWFYNAYCTLTVFGWTLIGAYLICKYLLFAASFHLLDLLPTNPKPWVLSVLVAGASLCYCYVSGLLWTWQAGTAAAIMLTLLLRGFEA